VLQTSNSIQSHPDVSMFLRNVGKSKQSPNREARSRKGNPKLQTSNFQLQSTNQRSVLCEFAVRQSNNPPITSHRLLITDSRSPITKYRLPITVTPSPRHPAHVTHSPTHPLTHSPIHPFTHSPIHPFIPPPVQNPFIIILSSSLSYHQTKLY
jgi:hypothetical protein